MIKVIFNCIQAASSQHATMIRETADCDVGTALRSRLVYCLDTFMQCDILHGIMNSLLTRKTGSSSITRLQELHCFRFDVGWISRCPPWSTCHCPAWLQPTLPPTASWSHTKVVVSCVLPHQGHALWDEHTATIKTGVLQLQVRSCGTAFQLNCDKLTLASNNLSGY